MEYLDQQDRLLSNYEVYKILKEPKPPFAPQNVRTIAFETQEYFGKVLPRSTVKVRSEEEFGRLMSALAEWPLTKMERLQLVNLRPTTRPELYLIVEECESRFNESKIEELMSLFQ